MPHYKIEIEYEGTHFCGWQVQSGRKKYSVQQLIEEALAKIFREKITIYGSGRTDAGVHALAQVAHFRSSQQIPPDKLQRSLNAILPESISISSVSNVADGFHSRFDARKKHYRYSILNRSSRSPFLRRHSLFFPHYLDVGLMRREARILLGRHDFRAFQGSGRLAEDTVRRVSKISVVKQGDLIYIDIEADGFLYTMVRSIVGTLIEIGRGKLPAGSLRKILASGKRQNAGPTAPPEGLMLMKVFY